MVANHQPNSKIVSLSRVLIIDRSAENREMLRTILKRRGCEIFEVDRDVDGLKFAK